MKKAHLAMAVKPQQAFEGVRFVDANRRLASGTHKLNTIYCLDLADLSTTQALDWIRSALEVTRQNKRGYTPRILVLGSRKELSKSGDEFAASGAVLFEKPKGFDGQNVGEKALKIKEIFWRQEDIKEHGAYHDPLDCVFDGSEPKRDLSSYVAGPRSAEDYKRLVEFTRSSPDE
jgi:hypothetical protein